jgi:1-aminocyclopropane-1-carboxylate deaminase/D-cysteine desulfhydrase-like pyridoxal-dependent ACC family enzyme
MSVLSGESELLIVGNSNADVLLYVTKCRWEYGLVSQAAARCMISCHEKVSMLLRSVYQIDVIYVFMPDCQDARVLLYDCV